VHCAIRMSSISTPKLSIPPSFFLPYDRPIVLLTEYFSSNSAVKMVSFIGFLTVLVTAATITAVYAVPAPASELSIFENLPIVPQGWYQGIAVPTTKRLRFRIAIKQASAYILEQHLLAISDPDHAKYGQHMKRDELKAMLRPSDEVSSAILGWLSSQGVPAKDIEDNGDWIK